MPIRSFATQLNRWFCQNARQLPWRETRDPYKIWISEVMLQQTTVATVIAYYERWCKVFPTVERLAQAPLEKVLKMWQGLGYYQRARNIHKTAQILVKDHGGKFPTTFEALRTLPGFGDYTTGAVLSIAFDQRVAIIDANIKRVIMRLMGEREAYSPSVEKKVYAFLDRRMPRSNLRTFNQALMELGALVCKNKEPLCSMCPVQRHCQAFKLSIQELIPPKKEKITEEIDVAVAVLKRNGKYFIQQRPSKGLLADLWEFPGGKIEKGESAPQALARELKEELNIAIKNVKPLASVRHYYTRFKVNLNAYLCVPEELPKLSPSRKWISSGQFAQYPMPSGTAKLVQILQLK